MKADVARAPAIVDRAPPPAREARARPNPTFSSAFAEARERDDGKRAEAAAISAAAPVAPRAPIETAAPRPVEAQATPIDGATGGKPVVAARAEVPPQPTPASTATTTPAESLTITIAAPVALAVPVVASVAVAEPATVPVAVATTGAESVAMAVAVAVAVTAAVAGSDADAASAPDAEPDPDADRDGAPAAVDPLGLLTAGPAAAPTDPITAPRAAAHAAPAAAPADSFATQARDQLTATDPHLPIPIAHARLVLGDDDRRVIVSVAMHHGTIDVAVRADDPSLAHALARSHAELDQALRNHGLALGDLSSRDGARNPHAAPPRPVATRGPRAGPDLAPSAPTTTASTDPRLRALA